MLLAKNFVNCGYSTQIKMDNKERIIRAIILKGLELYFLVNQMNVNAEACRPLFVPGTITKVTFILNNLPCSSQLYLWCILYCVFCIDCMDTAGALGEVSEFLAVQHVLQWMTGQAHTPILPSEKQDFKITFRFNHECRERLGDLSSRTVFHLTGCSI
uniref:Uncharacterized protein n=1 Tax=Fundulus heteroclitus TaxID=8078 RepID=A0A3Q2PIP7_FUNHE